MKLTKLQVDMYNGLLDLSWDMHVIEYADLYVHLGDTGVADPWLEAGTSFAKTLRVLEKAKLVLTGPEDVEGIRIHTVSPIVKGGNVYSHPRDFYTTKFNFLVIHQLPEGV